MASIENNYNAMQYEINPMAYPFHSYPTISVQPVVPPPESEGKLKASWLTYFLACTYCALLVGFVTFMVLFIIAISGGFGSIRGGRSIMVPPIVDSSAAATASDSATDNVINNLLKESFSKLNAFKQNFQNEVSLRKSLLEKIKKF